MSTSGNATAGKGDSLRNLVNLFATIKFVLVPFPLLIPVLHNKCYRHNIYTWHIEVDVGLPDVVSKYESQKFES